MGLALDSVIRVCLAIQSSQVTPEEIAAAIGVEPDTARRAGERLSPRAPTSRWHTWAKRLAAGESVVLLDEAWERLAALGEDVAIRVGELVRAGSVDATLVIVQDVNDTNDHQQYGLSIAAHAVRRNLDRPILA